MQAVELATRVLQRPTYRARARELRTRRGRFDAALIESFLGQARAVMRSDPMHARQCARLGLYVARKLDDATSRLQCLRVLAQADTVAGRYPEALRAIDESLRHLRLDGTARERADMRAMRVQVLTQLERYAEAGETGRRVLRALQELGDERGVIRTRMALADLAIQLDRPREALRHFRQVEYLLPPDAPARLRGAIAANRGNALQRCRRFRAGERWFRIARGLFESQGCEHTVAQIDYNLAYSAVRRGRYEEALRGFADVERRFARLGDDMHRAHIDLNRAELYMHLELADEARGHAERAGRAFGELGLERDRAQADYFAARAAAMSGELEEADERYAAAQDRFVALHLPGWVIKCLVQRAYVAQRLGQAGEAAALAEEAQAQCAQDPEPLSVAAVRLLQANLAQAQERAAEALTHAAACRESLRRLYAPWMLVEAGRVEGAALRLQGRTQEAIEALMRTVETIERHRGGVPPDEYMTAYLAARAEIYEELVDLLVREGRAEEAFGYAERAKSRALLDLLVHRADAVPELPGWQGRRIRVLREALNAVYWQLFQDGGGVEPVDPFAAQEAHRRAADLEGELQRLLRAQSHEAARGRSPAPVAAPTPDAVRAGLEADTIFLDYLLTRRGLITFVVTRDGVHAVRQAVEEEEIEEAVQRLRFHLAKHERGSVRAPDLVMRATRDNLARLADRLIQPVAPRLRCRTLVVSAHGVLHGVPFHALPWGDGWLYERFDVIYAPSAAVHAHCARHRPRAGGPAVVLGVADEAAPQVEAEARRVAGLLGTDRVHLGAEASLEVLREAAPSAQVLHVATHGVFRRANPALSALRLGDGWVTLYDLRSLDVRGALVVLSTCESGVAAVSAGNEIQGVARGFLHAGARSLLCAQWRVRDEGAALWMQAFYEALRDGVHVAEAQRSAMAAVRRTHPHPYHWAPFFLMGAAARAVSLPDAPRSPSSSPNEGTTR